MYYVAYCSTPFGEIHTRDAGMWEDVIAIPGKVRSVYVEHGLIGKCCVCNMEMDESCCPRCLKKIGGEHPHVP